MDSIAGRKPSDQRERSSSSSSKPMSNGAGSLIRFTKGKRCPVCNGAESDPRGQGIRCSGFMADGWANCSREEHAGKAKYNEGSQTWAHKATGPCPCGTEHAAEQGAKPKRGTIDR